MIYKTFLWIKKIKWEKIINIYRKEEILNKNEHWIELKQIIQIFYFLFLFII